MIKKIEGTFFIDGLIQGPLPACKEAESSLHKWCDDARDSGLKFNLDFEGSMFSALADNRPAPVDDIGDLPSEKTADAIRSLLKLFRPDQIPAISSTVRSVEYRVNQEVQTIYVIGTDGSVSTPQRVVAAQTEKPAQPKSPREMIKMAAIGLLALAGLFAISSIFVDYRQLYRDIAEKAAPINPDEIIVDNANFAEYFTVKSKSRSKNGGYLILTLEKTAQFPSSPADVDKAITTTMPATRRLAAEAIARGRLTCRLYDKEQKIISHCDIFIDGLRSNKTVEISIPIPPNEKPAKIELRF